MELFHLARGQTRSIDLGEGDFRRLTVRGGSAWVTLAGDARDYVLDETRPGEFSGPGRLVIEAIEGDLEVIIL